MKEETIKQPVQFKFSVDKEKWNRFISNRKNNSDTTPLAIRQGYISTDNRFFNENNGEELKKYVRVRTIGSNAYITIKLCKDLSVKNEWEIFIPLDEAEGLLDKTCRKVVTKDRYQFYHGDILWNVDVMHGDLEGLIIAEVKLDPEMANYSFPKPDFVIADVTKDVRYYFDHYSEIKFSSFQNYFPNGKSRPYVCNYCKQPLHTDSGWSLNCRTCRKEFHQKEVKRQGL